MLVEIRVDECVMRCKYRDISQFWKGSRMMEEGVFFHKKKEEQERKRRGSYTQFLRLGDSLKAWSTVLCGNLFTREGSYSLL